MFEGIAIFVFYDLVFLACLIFFAVLEHYQKVQAQKKAKAIRKSRVKQARIEYLKMIS